MSKKFHFLTGGTGLLGSYILRSLLKDGHSVVVLARASKKANAEKRIDQILSDWEQSDLEAIPRPLVISGNLLDSDWVNDNRDWFARSCQSIIHCAASLTFYGTPGSEPWLSNIEGTRRILDLAQQSGIRKMHYVSTAYIAGSSKKFFEKQTDIGQSLRNDYEKSKFEAEKMVRQADFLDEPTIYRPSIVVGDSRTGYTTTYHGFYAVLKLAHTLVQRLPLGATSGRGLLTALGMNGNEHKNFVPVDWVVDVFRHIFSNPEYHGQTYHLTSPEPPLLSDFVDMVQDAVETFSILADKEDPHQADENWFFQNYTDQVQIYRAYLQNDPYFDSQNTQTVAPHLPCPVMDRELMLFLARYAILSGFGKKKKFIRQALSEALMK